MESFYLDKKVVIHLQFFQQSKNIFINAETLVIQRDDIIYPSLSFLFSLYPLYPLSNDDNNNTTTKTFSLSESVGTTTTEPFTIELTNNNSSSPSSKKYLSFTETKWNEEKTVYLVKIVSKKTPWFLEIRERLQFFYQKIPIGGKMKKLYLSIYNDTIQGLELAQPITSISISPFT